MKLDITNHRFGRLRAVSPVENTGDYTKWSCVCDCGNIHIARLGHLRAGRSRSCGCLNRDMLSARKTHGMRDTPEYKTWCNIRNRCENERHISYKYYGARGIKVCERWQAFEPFFEDMGRRPSKDHSIDRKDSAKDYSPDNCKWSTEVEQQNNRSDNMRLTFNGVTRTESQWCRLLGFRTQTIGQRVKRGWSVEKAMTTPI